MRYFSLIICLTILLRPVMPVIDYAVNYDFIRENLCVNKAQPAMHCNGKCYLMKHLAAAADNDKPASSEKKHVTLIEASVLFCAEIGNYDYLFFNNEPIGLLNFGYNNHYRHSVILGCFRPPTINS